MTSAEFNVEARDIACIPKCMSDRECRMYLRNWCDFHLPKCWMMWWGMPAEANAVAPPMRNECVPNRVLSNPNLPAMSLIADCIREWVSVNDDEEKKGKEGVKGYEAAQWNRVEAMHMSKELVPSVGSVGKQDRFPNPRVSFLALRSVMITSCKKGRKLNLL